MKINDFLKVYDTANNAINVWLYNVKGSNGLAMSNSHYKIDGSTPSAPAYNEAYTINDIRNLEVFEILPSYSGISIHVSAPRVIAKNDSGIKVLEGYNIGYSESLKDALRRVISEAIKEGSELSYNGIFLNKSFDGYEVQTKTTGNDSSFKVYKRVDSAVNKFVDLVLDAWLLG